MTKQVDSGTIREIYKSAKLASNNLMGKNASTEHQ